MSTRPLVYLAGPIKGLTYDGATTWRDDAVAFLKRHDIDGLSPMRGKDFLRGETFDGRSYSHPLASPRGIFTRDRYDVRRCDLVVMNLVEAAAVSIGTMFEAAWSVAYDKPLVVVLEADGSNCHNHPFLHEAAGFVTTSLDEALDLAVAILHPDPCSAANDSPIFDLDTMPPGTEPCG